MVTTELFAHSFGSNLGFLGAIKWQDPAISVPVALGPAWSKFSHIGKKFLDIVKPPLLSSNCRSALEPAVRFI